MPSESENPYDRKKQPVLWRIEEFKIKAAAVLRIGKVEAQPEKSLREKLGGSDSARTTRKLGSKLA